MEDFPIVKAARNVTRQVLSHHPDLMVVAFRFTASRAIGSLHEHAHVQSTYVESGRFRVTLDAEEREVAPGDSFTVPSGQTHGCVCFAPGTLIDSFTPRRNDVL
ncbi:MAG: cupin domain-containing protein [Pseudomonadota bacterium]